MSVMLKIRFFSNGPRKARTEAVFHPVILEYVRVLGAFTEMEM